MKSEVGRSIMRNLSVMFGAQGLTWISGFVLLFFLPRYLGSEDFGRLYLAMSVVAIMGLLVDFGGNYLIPKEVARSRIKGVRILGSYIILRIFLWILSIGVILLISHLLGYSGHVNMLILILAVGKLWESGVTAFNAYFQGIERMEFPSMATIAERLFVSLFAVGALLLGADSITVAIIMTLGGLINVIIIVWLSRKFVTVQYKFDTEVFSLLNSGMPFFLFSLFSVIYYRIDAMMVSSFTNEMVTGWYGGAYRFLDIVMVLPILYKTAVFPIFSRLWDNKDGVLESTVGESLRLMIILGIPSMLLIALFAEPIIDFFMGLEEYGPSVLVLQIFAIGIPIIYIDVILGSALMGAANRERAWAMVGLLAIGVNIGFNYFMIPYTQQVFGNGGLGAATATIITELFVMVSAFLLLPRGYLQTFRTTYLLKPVAAGCIMLVAVLLLSVSGLYWILTALAGGVVYIAALFLVKTFSQAEIELIRELISVNQLKLVLTGKTSEAEAAE